MNLFKTKPERLFCAIVTSDYLPHARALAADLKRYHPQIPLVVLLLDDSGRAGNDVQESFVVIRENDFADAGIIASMRRYYTRMEYCCALRGFLQEYIFDRIGPEQWIFFDADVRVYHPLENIFDQLQSCNILLSPHSTKAIDRSVPLSQESNILIAGNFNAGFMGLRRSRETERFIRWYKSRLTYFAFDDHVDGVLRGLFLDQKWLNLVPFFFEKVQMLTYPGANLGHWNLLNRNLQKAADGRVTVDGAPLLFVHFSGWGLTNGRAQCRYTSWYHQRDHLVWQDLVVEYFQILKNHGWTPAGSRSNYFRRTINGLPVDFLRRRQYARWLASGGDLQESAQIRNPLRHLWVRLKSTICALKKKETTAPPI